MQTKLNIKSSSKIFIADSASLKLGNPSTPPPVPTYNLYFYGSPDDEGNNGTIYLQTTNVTAPIPYTITGVSEEDVSIPLTGFFNPGSDALSFSIAADNLTEGPETMVVTLDGITPTVSAALVINDTSIAPVGNGPILFYDATNTASYPGTGTRIYDLTTNSLTGTLVGGPTFNNVSGDKYFTWTTGDYLYTPTLDEGSIVKALTGDRPPHSVEVWSYPTVASRIMFTYNGSATENSGYHFSAMELAGGKAYFGLWTSPNSLVSTPAPANNISTNAWHQFVLVYDGTTIIGYVDGVEVSRTTTNIDFRTPHEMTQGNLRMMFGAFSATNNGGSTQRFSGRWRKMKVYDRALTSSEVLANYNAG